MTSIAEQVHEWLDQRPYLQLALQKDLINYSSLARLIQSELGVTNFDAVIVAIRRYSPAQQPQDVSERIRSVLQQSTLEIKTGMQMYLVRDSAQLRKLGEYLSERYTHCIGGNDYSVIISDRRFSITPDEENLVKVRIKSPEAIRDTPGVVCVIYQRLFEYQINVRETYSSHTDTILLIDKADMTRTVECLNGIGIC